MKRSYVKTFEEFVSNLNKSKQDQIALEIQRDIERQKESDEQFKKANLGPEATLMLLQFIDEIQKENNLDNNLKEKKQY